MSMTIGTLIVIAAGALKEMAPEIKYMVKDVVRDNMKNGNIKQFLKCTDWKQVGNGIKHVGADIEDMVEQVNDYVNYHDADGGWTKK